MTRNHTIPNYHFSTMLIHLIPAQRPRVVADLFNASRLPMFPKQTQLQNRTLSIQIPVSMVSCLASPPRVIGSE